MQHSMLGLGNCEASGMPAGMNCNLRPYSPYYCDFKLEEQDATLEFNLLVHAAVQ